MICPSCQSSNNEHARFCQSCGAELALASEKMHASAPRPGDIGLVDDEVTRVRNEHLQSGLSSRSASASVNKVSLNDPLNGRTIEGKYRLDAKLGAGGMGSVYRATRLVIGDEVAIKILHAEQNDQRAAERFRREAQAAARLKHPNAINIYDFGVTEDGLQYLVMELVEGESLRRIIKQQGPLTPSAAAEIIRQVCAALDEAHRHNIIHRDIKPDNIIVEVAANRLRVKVLDFGIAKLRDDTAGNLTQTGSVLGTPHYMSPEQCLGEELDSRSDIYSLGIVLYEMLAGVVPFNSPISTAVVVQHVNQPPPLLRTLNPGIARSVEVATLHALEKTREARPQTAGAFAGELSTAVANPDRHIESVGHGSRTASESTVVMSSASRSAISGPSINSGSFPTARKSRAVTVGLTIVVTLFLVALGGFGFQTLFGARGESPTGGRQNSAVNQPTPAVSQPPHTPITAPVSATPAPVIAPINTPLLTSEVHQGLNGWSGAARSHDLDSQMTYYADTVDPYFKRRHVSKAEIQSDRAVAYRRYSRLDVQLSNISVVFDQTGTQATATFDKTFAFEGEKHFSGSVYTKLWLTKFGSRWLITGERDLKVHYINN
jgi:serine/threonine protein kinase